MIMYVIFQTMFEMEFDDHNCTIPVLSVSEYNFVMT